MQEKNDTDVSFCGRFADLLNNCEYSQRQVAVKLGLTEGSYYQLQTRPHSQSMGTITHC